MENAQPTTQLTGRRTGPNDTRHRLAAVIVLLLTMLGASCTGSAPEPAPSPVPFPFHQTSYEEMGTGILDGTWTTSRLRSSPLRTSLTDAGSGPCAPAAIGDRPSYRYRLHIDGGNWSLEALGRNQPSILAHGGFHSKMIDPFRYRVSISTGIMRLVGRVRRLFRGSQSRSYGLAFQMHPRRASPSCVATAESLAWFRAPFLRGSAPQTNETAPGR